MKLEILRRSFPIAGGFRISRGAKSTADVVQVRLTREGLSGQGECVPYGRYGETADSVVQALEEIAQDLGFVENNNLLQQVMPPGAARNALDCAFWDLIAKRQGKRVWDLLDLPAPQGVVTAYTISLDAAQKMGRVAAREAHRPLLKIKLGQHGDLANLAAVHRNAPKAKLIVDANEAWSAQTLERLMPDLPKYGVVALEQPLRVDGDGPLEHIRGRPLPIYADESFHHRANFDQIAGRYDGVNIKLDKTGGLTEAHACVLEARKRGLKVMVGCMVGSSLSMAPAMVLGPLADLVDLDGSLLLQEDMAPAIAASGSTLSPPDPGLWG